MRGSWTIVTYIVLGYCEVQTCMASVSGHITMVAIDRPSHYGISRFSIEMCMQLEKEREIIKCSMCVRKYKACAKV